MIKVGNLRELLFFGIVGFFATITHYVCAIVSVEVLQFSLYSSNFLAYLCALVISYIGQAKLAFKAKINWHTFAKFIMLSFFNFLLSQVILYFLGVRLEVEHRVAFIVVVIFIPVVSYVFGKFWVYK